MYKNKRELNVSFGKSGSGSVSCRIALPKPWMNAIGITEDDRAVTALFDGEKIIIQKNTPAAK